MSYRSFLTGRWAAAGLVVLGAVGGARGDALTDKGDAFLKATRKATGLRSVVLTLDGPWTDARATRLRALGAHVYRHLPLVGSVAVQAPARSLDRIAALPFVRHLSLDATLRKTDDFTVGSSGADIAWQRRSSTVGPLLGLGVGVAVLDSGVDASSPDLLFLGFLPRVAAQVNFVAGQNTTQDQCGHGTHVAGIIAGNGLMSLGTHPVLGIAPAAHLVSVRVLDRMGQGNVSDAIAGIQWVINNRVKYRIRVLNFSAGHPVGDYVQNDPLCRALEAAWKAGIVVVCSAGNGGRSTGQVSFGATANEGYGAVYGSVQSPGNSPYAITVGAMKRVSDTSPRGTDRIATYSSRGPTRLDFVLKPDIVAPGNRIVSLNPIVDNASTGGRSYLFQQYSSTNSVPMSYFVPGMSGQSPFYFRLSGTSMAAPVVAGAAALLLDADASLTPDTVKMRLMVSADKWVNPETGQGDPLTYGSGYLNIPAALDSRLVATRYALSPTVRWSPDGKVYLNADAQLWGTPLPGGLTSIWGDKAIWGSDGPAPVVGIVDATKAVWGSLIWGDKAIWGSPESGADLSPTTVFGE